MGAKAKWSRDKRSVSASVATCGHIDRLPTLEPGGSLAGLEAWVNQ